MTIETQIDAARLAGTLVRFARLIDRSVREAAGKDLGVVEISVLGAIDRGIDLPSAIARELQLDPARVTRVVDQLVRLDYVERGIDAGDRRRCPVGITATGRSHLEEDRRVISNAVTSLLDRLPDARRKGLVDGLEHVRALLDVAD